MISGASGGVRRFAIPAAALAVAVGVACIPERDRPTVFSPTVQPVVVIESPQSADSPIPTPGTLWMRVRVTETSALLDQVTGRAVRQFGDSLVAETAVSFDPAASDTTLLIGLELDAFPTNTQMYVTATAHVASVQVTSEPVAFTTLDCSESPPYCP